MAEHMSQIAQQIGVSPPSGSSMSEKTLSTKLHALSGDSFDKSYIQAMIEDHKKDLAAFKQEAANGSDPAVKAAAEKGARVVASHLQLAEQIAKSHDIEVRALKVFRIASRDPTNNRTLSISRRREIAHPLPTHVQRSSGALSHSAPVFSLSKHEGKPEIKSRLPTHQSQHINET